MAGWLVGWVGDWVGVCAINDFNLTFSCCLTGEMSKTERSYIYIYIYISIYVFNVFLCMLYATSVLCELYLCFMSVFKNVKEANSKKTFEPSKKNN